MYLQELYRILIVDSFFSILMQNSQDYHAYDKLFKELKRVVFHIPGVGIVRVGQLVRNVTPASVMVGPQGDDIDGNFLSRVFVHRSKKEGDVQELADFVRGLGFVPVVCADYPILDSEDTPVYSLTKQYSHRTVLIVSSRDEYTSRDICSIVKRNKKNFADSSAGGKPPREIHIATYDPNSKPLKQKLYDAVLYAERWSLLTTQEKVIRCVASVLSLALPLLPPLLLLSYIGNLELREQAYNMNLLPWQCRLYANASEGVYDVMVNGTDKAREKAVQSYIIEEAKKRGFVKEHEGEGDQPTDLGKAVSEKHNLLLVASSEELTKRQLWTRITTFLVLAFVCLAHMVALACHLLKCDKAALYCSMLSYLVIFAEGIYLLSLKTTTSKICAAVCMMFAVFMLTISAFFLYTGCIMDGYVPIVSSVMVMMTAVVLCVTLLCNQYYKQDRELVAKLGGLSTTACVSMKKQISALDDVKHVNVEGNSYQFLDKFKFALFNAYKAGLFGVLPQHEPQNDCRQENEGSPSVDIEARDLENVSTRTSVQVDDSVVEGVGVERGKT
ncbi:putative membrane protein [Ehrlichia chaffeensis str. Liberty]|nr:putative membrane protein [Ehrlichia chaffeensis str. Liberty]